LARPNEHLSYFNRIVPRHVDFLLCKPGSMKPILGIELDDSSHAHPRRQQRDAFVNEVFKAARLPLLRVAARREYHTRDLAAQIERCLAGSEAGGSSPDAVKLPQPAHTQASEPAAAVPTCPKCGMPMVVRTARRGKNRGQQFYGCPNYPKCRQMLPLEDAGS
jgi:hypothetical protein